MLILPDKESRFHTLSLRPRGGICSRLAAWHRKPAADSSTAWRRFGMTTRWKVGKR